MAQTSFRKGLGKWDAAKDAAMGGGLDSSLDLPAMATFNQTEQSGTIDFLAHKLRLEPRAEEAGVLSKLEEAIDTLISRNYGDIDEAVRKFFEQMESMSKLDPMELERTILTIQKTIYLATDTVNSLYQAAYFADRVQQDEYWQAFKGLDGDGKKTIGDRQAHAYEVSRDSRFYYYYSFLLWRRVSEKLSSLKDLQRTLEFFRTRTQKDKAW